MGRRKNPRIPFPILFRNKIQHVFLLTFSWLILASYSLANGPSQLTRATRRWANSHANANCSWSRRCRTVVTFQRDTAGSWIGRRRPPQLPAQGLARGTAGCRGRTRSMLRPPWRPSGGRAEELIGMFGRSCWMLCEGQDFFLP